MTLTGKVVSVDSGSLYTDKKERITVKFANSGAGYSYDRLLLINESGYKLDDEITLLTPAPLTVAGIPRLGDDVDFGEKADVARSQG